MEQAGAVDSDDLEGSVTLSEEDVDEGKSTPSRDQKLAKMPSEMPSSQSRKDINGLAPKKTASSPPVDHSAPTLKLGRRVSLNASQETGGGLGSLQRATERSPNPVSGTGGRFPLLCGGAPGPGGVGPELRSEHSLGRKASEDKSS